MSDGGAEAGMMRRASGTTTRRQRRASGRAWGRGADERGVSLLELVIALTLFAMIMLGVAATVDTGLQLTRNNRNRSVAANLASQEMDRVRSADFFALGAGTSVESVDGVEYDVTRELTWVPQDSTTGPCDGSGGDPALLRVRVRVEWANMRGVQPVVSDTVLTPPVGAYDPDTGHISVKVLDRDAEPLVGTMVSVTGPDDRSLITNSDGCAFFAFLDPGTYTVSLGTGGYVDRQGDTAPEQVVGVQIGAVASAQFDYDRAATLELALDATGGGTIPDGVPVTLANSQLLPNGLKSFPGTGTTRTLGELFPSAEGYQAFAGSCADADPEGIELVYDDVLEEWVEDGPYWEGAARDPVMPTTPAGTTAGTVTLDSGTVEVLQDALPLVGAEVVATHPEDSACDGESYTLGTTDASGRLTAALPYGTWELSVTGSDPAGAEWPSAAFDPTVSGTPVFTVEVDS